MCVRSVEEAASVSMDEYAVSVRSAEEAASVSTVEDAVCASSVEEVCVQSQVCKWSKVANSSCATTLIS